VDYKDYYDILGVPKDADAKTIKKAFRKQAREHHPDVNPDDPQAEERFKDLSEAYEVLSDPEKRAKYDRFGREWQRYQQTGAPGGFDWGQWAQAPGGQPGGPQYRYATEEDLEGMFGGAGFSDFFETLFGRSAGGMGGRARAPQPRAERGRDIRHPVQVTLPEAYHGTKRLLNKDGRRLEVTIPRGVKTGSKVRVRGEGAQGLSGGPDGDLFLEVELLPDDRFERKGDDLYTEIEVPLTTAVLGGEARVPTMSGAVQLTVPPETQNGKRFRLGGKGMPKLKSPDEHGDLYATVRVKIPTGLTDDQRELFERLRELS